MARKKLLTEGEIRQFMKLARLRPASGNRLQELGPYPPAEGEEDEEGGEAVDPDAPPELEDIEDEDEDILDVEDEPLEGEEKMVSMDDFMTILDRAVEEVTGEEADVSYEEDPEPEELEEPGPGFEDAGEPEGGALPQLEEPAPGARDMYENQDQVVAEVARRVAARLDRENKKEQIADQLAERIMKRLTK